MDIFREFCVLRNVSRTSEGVLDRGHELQTKVDKCRFGRCILALV